MIFPRIKVVRGGDGLGLYVFWPERKVPKSESFETKKMKVWGYLLDYQNVDLKKRAEMINEGKEKEAMLLDGDFLVLVFDKKKQRVKIAVDMGGQFPLYFTKDNGKMIMSPDFGVVFKEVKNPKINVAETLDYMLTEYFLYQTGGTFIDQVNRLQAGCVLTIEKDLSWQVSEPVKMLDIIANSGEVLTADEAVPEIEKTLMKVIKRRSEALGGVKLLCDMSSGFDCMLVADLMKRMRLDFEGNSWFTKINNHDSDPNIVKEWAEKKGVKCNFIDLTDLLFFNNKEDLEWNVDSFFPGWHSLSMFLKESKELKNMYKGQFVRFTGNGGDEFLHAGDYRNHLENLNKSEWEFANDYVQCGGENILTKEAYGYLTSWERFEKTKFYSGQYMGGGVGYYYFPIFWKYGNWTSSPYVSLEMTRLSQRLPRYLGDKIVYKHDLYHGRTDAFIPSQYRAKVSYHEQVYKYLDVKKDLIEKILENSVLGKLGLVQISEIRKAMHEGKIKELVKEHYLMFGNMLRLEVFFQFHGMKV